MPKQAEPPARLEGSRWTPYLFVAPVAVYLLVFQGYPLLQELILGFTSTSLLSPWCPLRTRPRSCFRQSSAAAAECSLSLSSRSVERRPSW